MPVAAGAGDCIYGNMAAQIWPEFSTPASYCKGVIGNPEVDLEEDLEEWTGTSLVQLPLGG